jgi:hypothetical protein
MTLTMKEKNTKINEEEDDDEFVNLILSYRI